MMPHNNNSRRFDIELELVIVKRTLLFQIRIWDAFLNNIIKSWNTFYFPIWVMVG